jgi:hypothetical protein
MHFAVGVKPQEQMPCKMTTATASNDLPDCGCNMTPCILLLESVYSQITFVIAFWFSSITERI